MAICFLLWAAICLFSPRYLRFSDNPLVSLLFYALGTLCLMMGVSGFGFEMAQASIWQYFGRLLSEGPSNIPWAGPSIVVLEYGGITLAFLVAVGFFHVAANVLLRRRVLEILLKLCGLFCAFLAALFLATVVDELIIKPLLVVPANRIASGQTSNSGGGFVTFLVSMLRALFVVATIISTITGAVVGVGYIYKRVAKLLRQPSQ